jgi:hypothetical protein
VGQDLAAFAQDHGVGERAGAADQGKVAGEEKVVLLGDGLAAHLGQELDDLQVVLLGPLDQVHALGQVEGDPHAQHDAQDQQAGVSPQLRAQRDFPHGGLSLHEVFKRGKVRRLYVECGAVLTQSFT